MTHRYKLRISLNVLEALGANLYSSMPAVVSEAVANSWDADAHTVNIGLDTDNGIVTIEDDGCGMSEDDINKKYLMVGYHKRDGEPETPEGRRPMGRKGIGKLSLFSMARIVQVESVKVHKDGRKEKNGFIMNSKDIEDLAKAAVDGNEPTPYHPVEIPADNIRLDGKGTRITLRDLKMEISKTRIHLRKRLARRFSVIGPAKKFHVFVEGKELKPEDRDYFNKLEYLWYIKQDGENAGAEYVEHCGKLKRSEELSDARFVDKTRDFEITGWVGSVAEHKDLEEGNNSIVVFARGKLFHEDILANVKEGGVFSKYLIGEIHADFLDRDELADMATTGRQLAKDEERFELLKDHIKKNIVAPIGTSWGKWRVEDAVKDAEEEEPKIKDWFDNLKPTSKPIAEKLFHQISQIRAPSKEVKRQLYKNAIIAFETLALKDRLKSIDSIQTEEGVEVLVEAFRSIGDLEAVHYYDITESRLSVLRKFAGLTELDAKEKVLQEYLFQRLWLLDASWEAASYETHKEETVTKEFKDALNLTDEEKRARIDLRYRSTEGKYVIIELKRYNVKVTAGELVDQINKYKSALKKCLLNRFPSDFVGKEPVIEAICVVGIKPTGEDVDKILKGANAMVITYDELIEDNQRRYADYLKKNHGVVDSIRKVVELLEKRKE